MLDKSVLRDAEFYLLTLLNNFLMLVTGIECNVVLILIFMNSEALTSFIRYCRKFAYFTLDCGSKRLLFRYTKTKEPAKRFIAGLSTE